MDNSGLAPSDICLNADIFPLGQAIETKGGGFLLPVITFTFNGLENIGGCLLKKVALAISLSGQ